MSGFGNCRQTAQVVDLKSEHVAQRTALPPTSSPLQLADCRQRIGLDGWNTFWPFQGTVAAVVFIRSIGLIGGARWHRGCAVQQAKKFPYRTEFKHTLQVGQFKDLLDPFRRIHQLKHDCPGTSRLPQAQQYSQAARIDALNLRQIDDQHCGVPLTEYCVAQYRTGVAGHNSAMAPQNAGVSQFLNRYLQHPHLLLTFPQSPFGTPSGFDCPKLAATHMTNEEQSD
jgi:hypothetical protein